MLSLKRFAAGASAVALASSALLAGAGAAGAQGSSEMAADLETAATALNGPVAVSAGPSVTYTNETERDQGCLGFTFPYSTVVEQDIDPSAIDLTDIAAALAFIKELEAAGGVSMLGHDEAGGPRSYPDPNPGGEPNNNDIVALVAGLALFGPTETNSVQVGAGETVTWSAPVWGEGDDQPEGPSAAAVICQPYLEEGEEGGMEVEFGIDPQVVADQINEKLGPLGSIQAGSVSGGSVDMGATLLGSVGSSGEAEGDAEAGDTGSGADSSAMSTAGADEGTGEVAPAAVG